MAATGSARRETLARDLLVAVAGWAVVLPPLLILWPQAPFIGDPNPFLACVALWVLIVGVVAVAGRARTATFCVVLSAVPLAALVLGPALFDKLPRFGEDLAFAILAVAVTLLVGRVIGQRPAPAAHRGVLLVLTVALGVTAWYVGQALFGAWASLPPTPAGLGANLVIVTLLCWRSVSPWTAARSAGLATALAGLLLAAGLVVRAIDIAGYPYYPPGLALSGRLGLWALICLAVAWTSLGRAGAAWLAALLGCAAVAYIGLVLLSDTSLRPWTVVFDVVPAAAISCWLILQRRNDSSPPYRPVTGPETGPPHRPPQSRR